MSQHLLFIQGGGDGGYESEKALVKSLQKNLGNGYSIDYPELTSEESKADFGWVQQIAEKIAKTESGFFIVGHSLGASMILKYLSQNADKKKH